MLETTNIVPDSVNFYKVLNSFYLYAGDKEDRYVQAECRINGYWDLELTQWMIDNIKPGWVCLDIGANTFYFTEIMSRVSGPSGKVLAFEPIKRLCNLYKTAKTLNDNSSSSMVEVYDIALSNKKDVFLLNIWDNNVGGSGITGADREKQGFHEHFGNFHVEDIDGDRLDAIYSEKIDFMKIDVEGHERFVFEGFSDEAWKCPLIVVELGWSQPDEFLVELDSRYTMEFLNGEPATFEKIKERDVVNVLLKRK
jgi:FkbM family methyltransferase